MPVTEFENKELRGLALCPGAAFDDTVSRAQTLRARQRAYLDSLPTDPAEAIADARKLLSHDYTAAPKGFEDALHLSQALSALIAQGDLDAPSPTYDAALYIAQRINLALHDTNDSLKRARDVLGNPARVERDRQPAN
jgi:hypothetical protein